MVPRVFLRIISLLVFTILLQYNADDLIRKLLLDLKNDIYNVHGDLASRITELHEVLRRIEGHWTKNADEASADVDALPEVPRVPDYLEAKFEAAIRATNSELQEEAKFPLAKGVNAFHHHFEQVRVPIPVEKFCQKLILEEHLEIPTRNLVHAR